MHTLYVCPDHEYFEGAYPSDFLAHWEAHHDGEPIPMPLPTASPTAEARLRLFRCRVCAGQVETRDPERPPYCDEHLPAPVTS